MMQKVKPKFTVERWNRKKMYVARLPTGMLAAHIRAAKSGMSEKTAKELLSRTGSFSQEYKREYTFTRGMKFLEVTQRYGREFPKKFPRQFKNNKDVQAYTGTYDIGDKRVGIFARSPRRQAPEDKLPKKYERLLQESDTSFFSRIAMHFDPASQSDPNEGEAFTRQNNLKVERGFVWLKRLKRENQRIPRKHPGRY
jgi:hypothetical protein